MIGSCGKACRNNGAVHFAMLLERLEQRMECLNSALIAETRINVKNCNGVTKKRCMNRGAVFYTFRIDAEARSRAVRNTRDTTTHHKTSVSVPIQAELPCKNLPWSWGQCC